MERRHRSGWVVSSARCAMPPKAKRARVEVEINLEEDRVGTDFTCPCNAAHVYKNAAGFEKHKSSATHIKFEEWKKSFVHELQKNDKIIQNKQDAKITSLQVDLRRSEELAQSNFQQYQLTACKLQELNKQCIDCLNYWSYPPGLVQFFPQHSACWWSSD